MTIEAKQHLRDVAKRMKFRHTEEFKNRLSKLHKGIPKSSHVNERRQAGKIKWLLGKKYQKVCCILMAIRSEDILSKIPVSIENQTSPDVLHPGPAWASLRPSKY